MTPLLRYVPWQLRDYLIERGLVTAALGLLFGYIVSLELVVANPDFGAPGEAGRRVSVLFLRSVLVLVMWFAALTGVNGLISSDRTRGYYRLLFSRPIGVPAYYLQGWLLHGIGVVAVGGLLLGIHALVVVPYAPPSLFLWFGMTWVLLGGVGFLLSALTRFEGLLFVGVYLISVALRVHVGAREDWVADLVRIVTMPVDRQMRMLEPAVSGSLPAAADAAWVTGYGLAALAAGLIVLHRRELGR